MMKRRFWVLAFSLIIFCTLPGCSHEHTYEAVVTEPTYTTGGYTTYTCTECGESYQDDATDPLDPIVVMTEYMKSVEYTNNNGGKTINQIEMTENGSVWVTALTYDNNGDQLLGMAVGLVTKDAALTISIEFPKIQENYHYTALYNDESLGEMKAKGTIEAETFSPDSEKVMFMDYTGPIFLESADTDKMKEDYRTMVAQGVNKLLTTMNTVFDKTTVDITIADFGFSHYR